MPNVSLHPEDFVLLTPVLVGGEVVRYNLLTSPSPTKTVDGVVYTPRSVYGLIERVADDSFDIETIEVVGAGEAAGRTERIILSRMMSMPSAWHTIVNAIGPGEIDWLDANQNGSSLGFNERYEENYGLGPTLWMIHNPTFGGSLTTINGSFVGLHYSPPLLYRNSPAILEGSVIPMHWDPDGVASAPYTQQWDHGGTRGSIPVLMWDQRQYYRLRTHYQGKKFHRLATWSFQREAWSPKIGDPGHPFYCTLVGGPACKDLFQEIYARDLSTGISTNLSPFLVGGLPLSMSVKKSVMVLTVFTTPNVITNLPSPFPSGYAAWILRRTSDDFCVAVAAKINDTGQDMRRPESSLWSRTLANPPLWSASNLLQFGNNSTARAAGWCGTESWIFTGVYAEVEAALQDLYDGGFLDLPIEVDLPEEVLAGTDGISSYYTDAWTSDPQLQTNALWEAVKADYDVDGLITLTNVRDRAATLIDDDVGKNAAEAVVNLWPVYAQDAYDATDAAQVEVAEMAVIAVLWRRGGSATTIEQVKWDTVFSADGMIARVRRTGARGHGTPSTNSGVRQRAETAPGGQAIRGWSDRDSLPPGYLPNRLRAED